MRESLGVSDEERELIEVLFDEWGEAEWDRMESDVAARVSLEIHRRFLARYLPFGRVLEVGAGAGRFTIELARSGRSVVVGDLSRVQLELNARHVAEAGCQAAIEARLRVDICDLSGFESASFDGVVAFGGPLSYVFDRAPEALSECLRVLRPGGTIVASVMSLVGSARHFLPNFPAAIAGAGLPAFDAFLRHGDQRTVPPAHPCQMFTADQVRALVKGCGGELVGISASNWLSLAPEHVVDQLNQDPQVWASFLDWEERFCTEAGAVDGGTHLLFAATRR